MNFKSSFYLGLIFSLLTTPLFSQELHTNWVVSSGGSSNDFGHDIIRDANGNVFVCGRYKNTADFDPSTGTTEFTSLGGFDTFIQKLDAQGKFIWAKTIGGALDVYSMAIDVDAEGDVYVTGYYSGTVDFDPSANTEGMTSNGSSDVYILKLDTDGNFIWAKSIGGTSGDQAWDLTVDPSDNVIVTGYYAGTTDFDPSAATYNLTAEGQSDIFIVKLNSDGDFAWANSAGGTNLDNGNAIITDADGNIYGTGYWAGTADFDPTSGVQNLISAGSYDYYIQKSDADGNLIWVYGFGDTGDDCGLSLAIDGSGNLLISGFFFETMDFDPGTGTTELSSNGKSDIHIMKMTTDGELIWAKVMGGTSNDHGSAIDVDEDDNIYVTGYFNSTVDFDPGAGVAEHTSNGGLDIFVVKLDSDGEYLSSIAEGGTSTDEAKSITCDTSGYAFITGIYRKDVDFNTGSGTVILTPVGGGDVFIQKLYPTGVGVAESQNASTISMYPNPSNGIINVDLGNLKNASIKVYSESGALIAQHSNINTTTYQLEISNPTGIYVIEVSSEGKSYAGKIVKE